MRPRCDRKPETSAAMVARKSRTMEGSEAAGAGTKRQRFSADGFLASHSVVVGRKNHYGSKSRRGTEVAALFYSLLESAKLAGVDPAAYLRAAAVAALHGERIPLPHELCAAA
jgi:hypothetical protein